MITVGLVKATTHTKILRAATKKKTKCKFSKPMRKIGNKTKLTWQAGGDMPRAGPTA